MFTVTLLLLDTFYTTIPQGHSLECHMCDSVGETNCFGATCIGSACIKRSGIIDGILRVQKMCQQISEPLLEYCDMDILWKGGVGIECICQTDYCNNTEKAFQNTIIVFLPLIIGFFFTTILSV